MVSTHLDSDHHAAKNEPLAVKPLGSKNTNMSELFLCVCVLSHTHLSPS